MPKMTIRSFFFDLAVEFYPIRPGTKLKLWNNMTSCYKVFALDGRYASIRDVCPCAVWDICVNSYLLLAVLWIITTCMIIVTENIIGNPKFHLPEGNASFAPRHEVVVACRLNGYTQLCSNPISWCRPSKQVLNEKQEYER
uniref:Uncharacterized protein n=1 Tax=Solanum lycopersicum TaxID=4081 RepID=A0A3Q7E8B3_SOLLC